MEKMLSLIDNLYMLTPQNNVCNSNAQCTMPRRSDSHYILRLMSHPTCRNGVRQEKKAAFQLLFLFFPPTCQEKMDFFSWFGI